jgi:hypothetical protein
MVSAQNFLAEALLVLTHKGGARTSDTIVTAPIRRVPDKDTLCAEKHLVEAHFDKLLEGGGVKVTPLVGFRLLSHPLFHLGVLQALAY